WGGRHRADLRHTFCTKRTTRLSDLKELNFQTCRHVTGGWQQVFSEAIYPSVVRFECHLFEQGVTNSHGDATFDLPLRGSAVDGLAYIMHRHHILHFN